MDIISLKRYRDIFLLGDVNLDYTLGHKKNVTITLENALRGYAMTQFFKKPTRRTMTSSTLLDVIYIGTNKDINSTIINTTISDHYLVGVTRSLNYTPTTKNGCHRE